MTQPEVSYEEYYGLVQADLQLEPFNLPEESAQEACYAGRKAIRVFHANGETVELGATLIWALWMGNTGEGQLSMRELIAAAHRVAQDKAAEA